MIRLLEFAQMFLNVAHANLIEVVVYYSNWNEAVWSSSKMNKLFEVTLFFKKHTSLTEKKTLQFFHRPVVQICKFYMV